MNFIKSKFHIPPSLLYWVAGITKLSDLIFFDLELVTDETAQIFKIALFVVYLLLIIWSVIYLFVKTYYSSDIIFEIKKLEQEKTQPTNNFSKDYKLISLKSAYEKIKEDRGSLLHIIKTKEDFTKDSNIINIIAVLVILYFGQNSINYFKVLGPIIFLVLILILIILCLLFLIQEINEKKRLLTPITFGISFFIYLIYCIGEETYIRNFGNEIIGSYFEKPEYYAQYYVNLFPEVNSIKNYRLPADVHVFSITEEGETYEEYRGMEHTEIYTIKYLSLKKIYWPNGGYLVFDESHLIMGEKVKCVDQDGKEWFIELTNEKVK